LSHGDARLISRSGPAATALARVATRLVWRLDRLPPGTTPAMAGAAASAHLRALRRVESVEVQALGGSSQLAAPFLEALDVSRSVIRCDVITQADAVRATRAAAAAFPQLREFKTWASAGDVGLMDALEPLSGSLKELTLTVTDELRFEWFGGRLARLPLEKLSIHYQESLTLTDAQVEQLFAPLAPTLRSLDLSFDDGTPRTVGDQIVRVCTRLESLTLHDTCVSGTLPPQLRYLLAPLSGRLVSDTLASLTIDSRGDWEAEFTPALASMLHGLVGSRLPAVVELTLDMRGNEDDGGLDATLRNFDDIVVALCRLTAELPSLAVVVWEYAELEDSLASSMDPEWALIPMTRSRGVAEQLRSAFGRPIAVHHTNWITNTFVVEG
jgi:hypothetical protein